MRAKIGLNPITAAKKKGEMNTDYDEFKSTSQWNRLLLWWEGLKLSISEWYWRNFK
jgi:hypothetical protein